jgi:thiosulfate/3-mercaptopyruvate sulfurtransferase
MTTEHDNGEAPSVDLQRPDAIVSAEWLSQHLNDKTLRIFDCTTYLDPPSADSPAPYTVRSGLEDYLSAHIPGANYLDLQAELSAPSADPRLRFTMPDADTLVRALAARGVNPETRVILYSRKNMQWATRVWWMLYAIGFDNAAVLDGGLDNWVANDFATSSDTAPYPATTPWSPQPRAGAFADREQVLANIKSGRTCTLNALSNALHTGADDRYGRPGRIPSSVNLPALELQNPSNRTFLSPTTLAAKFAKIVPADSNATIVYCGGGIAATLDAFLMLQLGYHKVSVYDASMSEWANDASLPMTTGADA